MVQLGPKRTVPNGGERRKGGNYESKCRMVKGVC